jgi:TolB-like protein/Flp pilus assembly protein TadD
MPGLFTELKRRNVFRVGAAYLVVAWLLIEVSDTVFPRLNLPEWTVTFVIVLMLLGLPVALFLSWAYELTPEGVKRSEEVASSGETLQATRRAFDWIIIAGLLLVVAIIVADRWWFTTEPGTSGELATVAGPPVSEAGAGQADGTEPMSLGVGVLPFHNLSPDPDNAFFAGGIHEEVLTHLSRMPGLRVISRTSMLRIAESDLDIRQIGERLGVTHVLEGSVRRAGEQVRVTVQLIDAQTDEHVWAENYDRRLLDVFAIQSEIALAIARQLRLNLAPDVSAQIGERPTQSQEAYDLFLRARALPASYDEARMRAAIELLRGALQADPAFAMAMGELGRWYSMLFHHVTRNSPDCELSRYWIDQALAREPGNPALQKFLGEHYYRCHLDYDAALAQLELAEQGLPGSSEIFALRAYILRRAGRIAEGIAAMNTAIALDPRSEELLHNQIESYALLGDLENAARVDRLLDDTPRSLMMSRLRLAEVRMEVAGDLDSIVEALAAEPEKVGSARILRILVPYLRRDFSDARLVTERLEDGLSELQFSVVSRPLWLAQIALAEGDSEQASSHAREALEQLDGALRRRPDDYRVLSARALALALLGDAAGSHDSMRRALSHPMARRDAMIGATLRGDEVLALAHVLDSEELATVLEDYLKLGAKYLHYDGLMLYPEFNRHRDHPEIRALAPDA